jgi:hypothetical protein
LAYRALRDPTQDPRFASIKETFRQTVTQELKTQSQTIITQKEEIE